MNKLNYNYLLLAIIIAAVVVRSVNIGKFGLGGDEKYTLMVMHGISWEGATQKEVFQQKVFTPKQFWEALSFKDFDEAIIRTDNGNSASYYGFMYVWKSIFGLNDGALRWSGVLFDVLTILFIFLFCKNILNKPAIGLIAGLLACFEPFLVAYSHQIRNYPMGIFLITAATYYFFILLQQIDNKSVKASSKLLYGSSIILGVFSHFYFVLFLAGHGLVFLIYYFKNKLAWKTLLPTYLTLAVFLALWFTIGSGRETIPTLKNKDLIFKNMALAKAFPGWVDVPSVTTIQYKVAPILLDNFAFTNGLYNNLIGKKNLIICIILSLVFVGLFQFKKEILEKSKPIVQVTFLFLFGLLSYFCYQSFPTYFIYFSLVLCFFYFTTKYIYLLKNKWFSIFIFLFVYSLFVPMVISVYGAIKAGHTANLYHKYLCYSFPLSFIFGATGLYILFQNKSFILKSISIILIIGATFFVYRVLPEILQDAVPKYNQMGQPRSFNPYSALATKIIDVYQPGDTVLYCSFTESTFKAFDKDMQLPRSVVDAQLTNIYLPKSANYIQMVDEKEPNKVFVVNGLINKKVQLFDFEGLRYRY